jgi:hypothetical protein
MGRIIIEKKRKAMGSHNDLLFFFLRADFAFALIRKPSQTYLKFRQEHLQARYIRGLKPLLPALGVPPFKIGNTVLSL